MYLIICLEIEKPFHRKLHPLSYLRVCYDVTKYGAELQFTASLDLSLWLEVPSDLSSGSTFD